MRSIEAVVAQHVEDAARLRVLRAVLVRAPHVRLLQLVRLDERISAHLDGIAVAGACGIRLLQQTLEKPGKGEMFAAAVRAIKDRDAGRLDTLLTISEALPPCRPGLLSAFGWVSSAQLRGLTLSLLTSSSAWRREVGLAACGMHRVDPGPLLLRSALHDDNADLRKRALRVAGDIGRGDLLEECLAALGDADSRCAFEAARAALWLGDREAAVQALITTALGPVQSAMSLDAARLVILAVSPLRAKAVLARLARTAPLSRQVFEGIAASGDPYYVPWLIEQMDIPKVGRLAGEALSFIVGIDLAALGLERVPPEVTEDSPSDDPSDDVTIDVDTGLPWPDSAKVAAWWGPISRRYPSGTRHFMGERPSLRHCTVVLKTGFQRQRIVAARHLALLRPSSPQFDVLAPAPRQQHLLAAITELPAREV